MIERFAIYFLVLLIGVILGYWWRLAQEVQDMPRIIDNARTKTIEEIMKPDNPTVGYYKKWVFIRRADGSVVIREN